MKKKCLLLIPIISLILSACSGNTDNTNIASAPISNNPTSVPGEHVHTFDTSKWVSDASYHWHAATCGHDVVSDKEVHHFEDQIIAPTYENGGYTIHTCTVCGYEDKDTYTEKLTHTYSEEWTATSTHHWRDCLDVGYEHLKIDEGRHDFEVEVTPPSEEAGGYTTHTCKVCGYSYVDNQTPQIVRHYDDKWSSDETKHWHACLDAGCEDIKKDVGEHDFEVVVTPVSYEADGYTTHTCKVCGYTYTDEVVPQLIHQYAETWSTDGASHWHACTDSGYEYLKKDEAQHDFEVVVTPASYEADGYTTHTCKVCGYKYTDDITARLTYTITFQDYDGSIIASKEYYVGQKVDVPSDPNRDLEGDFYFTFEGWSPEVKTTVDGDAVYVATYSKHECTTFIVKYNANGGENAPSNQSKNPGASISIPSSKPSYAGHYFVGWNSIFEDKIYQPGDSFNVDHNVTLWAMWDISCANCSGNGKITYTSTCSMCSGSGVRRTCNSCGSTSIQYYVVPYGTSYYKCNSCGGTNISTKTCSWCSGKGSSTSTYTCDTCNGVGHYPQVGKPSSKSVQPRSIELNTIAGYEYSMDGVNWQSSPLFEHLVPSTSYTFYQRIATKDEVPFSPKSLATTIATQDTDTYFITYELNGGTNSQYNPTSYSYYGSSITLRDPVREHYNFAGWTYNGSSVTKIDPNWEKDVTLVANWTVKDYTITYDLDGGSANNPVTHNITSSAIVLQHPTRNGYTFLGWTGSNGNEPELDVVIPAGETGNLSYTAHWSLDTYTITYELYGGTNALKNPTSFTINDNIELKDAKKDYYTFEGWYLDASFKQKITNINGHYGNLTLHAHFVPFSYNATFDAGEGNFEFHVTYIWGGNLQNTTRTYKNGDTFYPYSVTIPTRSGYLFNGWYFDSALTEPIPETLEVTSDLTLYAKWFATVDGVVKLTSGGKNYYCYGDGDKTSEYFYVAPTYSGTATITYTLKGYYYTSSGVKPSQFTFNDLTGGSSLYRMAPQSSSTNSGTVEIDLVAGHTYYIHVASFGSSGTADVTIKPTNHTYKCEVSQNYNIVQNYEENTKTTNPVRSGYDFVRWNDNEGNPIHDVWDYTSDQTFTAEWTLHHYQINYELNGGVNNEVNPSSYTIEDGTIVLANPTREGYTFEGWFKDANYQNQITEINCANKVDYTLYAKWVADYFAVEYELNGGTNNPGNKEQIAREEDFTLLDPSKEGYSFAGWYLEPSFTNQVTILHGSERTNQKVYAKWVANTYTATLNYDGGQNCPTVRFMSQGQVIRTVDLYKDSTLSYFIPEAPSASLVFAGWYKDSAFKESFSFNETVNKDLTLYAKWISINDNSEYSSLGNNVDVSISGIENQYIAIISLTTQTVTVSSISDLDLYGAIYDANMNVLYSNDDISDDDLDFSVTFTMEAGKIYYIAYKANQTFVTGNAVINITGAQLPDLQITGDYTVIIESFDVTFNSAYSLPIPKREGYTFLGWFDEFGNPVDTSSWHYAANTTLYAHWAKVAP